MEFCGPCHSMDIHLPHFLKNLTPNVTGLFSISNTSFFLDKHLFYIYAKDALWKFLSNSNAGVGSGALVSSRNN